MQKFFKRASIAVIILLLALFYSPRLIALRNSPTTVAKWEYEDSLLLSSDRNTNAVFVRSGSDERLASVQDDTYTVSLFGIVPLKNITVVSTSDQVALSGVAVGVILYTNGVQIVGLGSIQTENGLISPAANAGLKRGDTILKINGVEVSGAEHFSSLIASIGDSCTVEGVRDGKEFSCTVYPAIDDASGQRRVGAWVRDSTSGVGTLSIIDPKTMRFAALGHAVTDIDTGVMLMTQRGLITVANIFDVERGVPGAAGELLGSFSKDERYAIGAVDTNSEFGIAGTIINANGIPMNLIEIAKAYEVRLGEATLYATVDGTNVLGYSCNVIRADVQSSPQTQGMIIEVTDKALLERTGGIVQGMSGSVLVQNGRLIGVVTHVFVNEPDRGYCLYAEWMYKKLLDN